MSDPRYQAITPEELAAKPQDKAPKFNGKAAHCLIKSSAEFVAGFVPPDYLIDGILQRRFLYSMTGKTGAGKTAVALLMAASVGLGKPIGDHGVQQGRVIYFAGENPDDICMRWIAMSQQMDFDLETIDVHFIPKRFKISEAADQIRQEVAALGGAALVIIDTSAAFFEGDDENTNPQQQAHAARLRSLIELLPGGPTILVLCHPTKNASDDNLTPRGGGAFIAEGDGNLTCRMEDAGVELHWQGKFRGPDFAPINFLVHSVTHERLKDTKGRLVPTVVAKYLPEPAQAAMAQAKRSNEDQLLALLATNGRASNAELAKLAGWFMSDGSPYKTLVRRTLKGLEADKLITRTRDGWQLKSAGENALKQNQP
jgi:hypothetical protein